MAVPTSSHEVRRPLATHQTFMLPHAILVALLIQKLRDGQQRSEIFGTGQT